MSTSSVASESSSNFLCGPGYLLIRRLQSLTGIMFGGYLIVHLTVNATIAQGGSMYQTQVDKIHSLPFLSAIEWGLLFIPLLFHAFYGIWITVNGRPNVGNYPYAKNIFYLLQRISAVIILLFVFFHVLSLKYGAFGNTLAFEPEGGAMQSIARHFAASPWLPFVVYPLGILASAYHTANGLWTGAITWGLTVSSTAQKRFGQICAIAGVVLAGLGLTAVVAAVRLAQSMPPAIPAAEHLMK